MRLLDRLRAPFYYGKGCGHFHNRRYEAATRFLAKAALLDPSLRGGADFHSMMGRAYFALGDNDKALDFLLRAYAGLQRGDTIIQGRFELTEQIATLIALSDALLKAGQLARAEEIACEAKQLSESDREMY